jgi:hypothetical protein
MSDQWLDDYVTMALDNQTYRNGIRLLPSLRSIFQRLTSGSRIIKKTQ